MDGTTIVIIIVGLLVLVGAALLMRRVNSGSAPGYIQLPRAAPPPAGAPAGTASALDSNVQRELRALLAQGQKIAAIKQVRELTGLGLKEAKDYVESLAAGAPVAVPTAPPVYVSTVDVEHEARAILAQGQKIAAIKRVRELTGLGLKEAKDYVESLAAGTPVAVPPAPAAHVPAADIEHDVRALLAQGQKIAAIKRVRELTGLGLKEAKDYVEHLEASDRFPS